MRASVEKVQVLRSGLHGVDQEFVAAAEAEHHDFEQTSGRVRPETKLTCGTVLVQIDDQDGVLGCVECIVGGDPYLRAVS